MNQRPHVRRQMFHHSGAAAVALLLAATGLAPAAALAAGETNPRVALGGFRGPQAARMRDAVEGALLRRYFVVPESIIAEAARQSGGRLRSDEDFAAVGKSLNVNAFLSATVRKQKTWQVDMVVRKGDTGQPIGRFAWSDSRIKSLAASLARSTPTRLRALMSADVVARRADTEAAVMASPQAEPPPPAPKHDTAAAATRAGGDDQDDEDDADTDAGPAQTDDHHPAVPAPANRKIPYMEFSVGGRVFNRSVTYSDNVSGLRAYKLSGATAISADIVLHPLASFGETARTWQAGLGLTGNLTYGVGVSSKAEGGASASTSVHGYEVGMHQQIVFGSLDLIPRVGYMADTFIANVGTDSPDVSYHSLRVGLATRVAVTSQTTIRASIDYLHVLSAGPLNDDARFPRATVRGLDASIGLSYRLSDSFEVDVQGALRRYGIDTKVTRGDPLIVGGAVDQYLSFVTGLTYNPTLGGP
jgi:hypothetical protein